MEFAELHSCENLDASGLTVKKRVKPRASLKEFQPRGGGGLSHQYIYRTEGNACGDKHDSHRRADFSVLNTKNKSEQKRNSRCHTGVVGEKLKQKLKTYRRTCWKGEEISVSKRSH